MLSTKYRVLSTVAGVAGVTVVAFNDPASSDLFPPCIFLSLTGFECPGCGVTRCVHQILNGNLIEALDLNILAVVAMPWLLWRFGRWLLGRQANSSTIDYRIIASIGAIVVAFGVLRNTDLSMFAFLAATE